MTKGKQIPITLIKTYFINVRQHNFIIFIKISHKSIFEKYISHILSNVSMTHDVCQMCD